MKDGRQNGIDNSKWLKAIYGKINNGILLIIDYAKEAKKYYTSKNFDGTIVSYKNQKMMNNVLDSPGNCDLTSHVCIETLINDAETLGFDTVGKTKQTGSTSLSNASLLRRAFDKSSLISF